MNTRTTDDDLLPATATQRRNNAVASTSRHLGVFRLSHANRGAFRFDTDEVSEQSVVIAAYVIAPGFQLTVPTNQTALAREPKKVRRRCDGMRVALLSLRALQSFKISRPGTAE